MTPPHNIAIVGGGIAGLATAYQLLQKNPTLTIDLFEKGSADSYEAGKDNSHRASLGASTARTMRLMGAAKGVGQWNVRETLAMLERLQADSGNTLFKPQASAFLGKPLGDPAYDKSKQSLIDAEVEFQEWIGKDAKIRWPGFYNTLPDEARLLVEDPYHPDHNPNGAALVINQEKLMQTLKTYLQDHGVTFHFSSTIKKVEQRDDKSVLTLADGSEHTADQSIIAPGQWIGELVDTKKHGIETRLTRVVYAQIDMQALGYQPNGFPFSKGFVPSGGEGSAYGFNADPKSPILKFLPAATSRTADSVDALHAPITDEEKDAALTAASIRFGIDKDRLREHTSFGTCAYTNPKIGEKALVARLDDTTTLIGLDSSGTARTIGGMAAIAAHLALGLPEPEKGSYDAFSLEAHHRQNNPREISIGPATATEIPLERQAGAAR